MYPQSLSPVQQVDFALLLVFVFSAVMLFILTVITIYFIWKFDHKRNPIPTDIKGNVKAEIIWTLIPSIMIMGLFYYGWTGFQALRTVPDNAMQVGVTAKMFSWTFHYENGKTSNYLAVPVGTPVKLNMKSLDVIHSLFVPAFRIKMDTVPGLQTYAWFRPDREGIFDIYCAEYCGLKHANMLSTVRAMPPKEFDKWLADTGPAESSKAGFAFMDAQGCFSCHDVAKDTEQGPTLTELYGKKITVIIKGKEKEVIADEDYLKEAIISPSESIVKGYDDSMPAYTDFTPEQMANMIDYLRSVGSKDEADGAARHDMSKMKGMHDMQNMPDMKGMHDMKDMNASPAETVHGAIKSGSNPRNANPAKTIHDMHDMSNMQGLPNTKDMPDTKDMHNTHDMNASPAATINPAASNSSAKTNSTTPANTMHDMNDMKNMHDMSNMPDTKDMHNTHDMNASSNNSTNTEPVKP